MPDTPSDPEVHTVGIFITYTGPVKESAEWTAWAEKSLKHTIEGFVQAITAAHLPKQVPVHIVGEESNGPASSTSD